MLCHSVADGCYVCYQTIDSLMDIGKTLSNLIKPGFGDGLGLLNVGPHGADLQLYSTHNRAA